VHWGREFCSERVLAIFFSPEYEKGGRNSHTFSPGETTVLTDSKKVSVNTGIIFKNILRKELKILIYFKNGDSV
jgi:hypothetical protein